MRRASNLVDAMAAVVIAAIAVTGLIAYDRLNPAVAAPAPLLAPPAPPGLNRAIDSALARRDSRAVRAHALLQLILAFGSPEQPSRRAGEAHPSENHPPR